MKKEIINKWGKKYYLLGTDKDNYKVWLEQSQFDCGWYWGIGYVEIFNKRYTDIEMHTHFDSLFFNHQKCCYDLFEDYFNETTLPKSEIWQLLEMMKTLYTLRNTSDMIHSRGSHITSNETEKEIFAKEYYQNLYKQINEIDIPELLKNIYALLGAEDEQ